jgi:hypothetical protein
LAELDPSRIIKHFNILVDFVFSQPVVLISISLGKSVPFLALDMTWREWKSHPNYSQLIHQDCAIYTKDRYHEGRLFRIECVEIETAIKRRKCVAWI